MTLGLPRKDCKPMAKSLIVKYGNLNNIITASAQELVKINGLGETSIFGLKLAKEINLYLAKESVNEQNVSKVYVDEIAKLAIQEIGGSSKEVFNVYSLNTKGIVISNTVSMGTLNETLAHPREIFKSAIDNLAASIVVVHNHPSGDLTPSDNDVYVTRRLVEAGKILGIELDDHVIVNNRNFVSLRKLGIIN